VSIQRNLDAESVEQCHPAPVLCLGPTDSVATAMQQMREHNRGDVLVCQNQGVVGIFTERDALILMASGAALDTPLQDVMTPDPMVLRATDNVERAITLMSRGGYRRLPIVDDHGRPTGMITVEGIMHYLVEYCPTLIYNLPPEPHRSAQMREGA
jgi:CBS domain-containing protein